MKMIQGKLDVVLELNFSECFNRSPVIPGFFGMLAVSLSMSFSCSLDFVGNCSADSVHSERQQDN